MASDKIVYYDDEFIRKFEKLADFNDAGPAEYPAMHRYLIDNFGDLFQIFQYYAKHIAAGDARDFEEADEETKRELMRPLSYRQYEMIARSFSVWEEETGLVVGSLWDYLHDNGRIYNDHRMEKRS